MKRISKFVLLVGTLLALFLMTLPTAGASADVRGGCNEETATALGEEYDLNPFAPIVTKMSPLCGEFLGPGIEAMAARAVPATCGGYAGWAVFRHEADGSWQLVFKERDGAWNLTAVGNDLEETDKILGLREPRCGKPRSTKTRVWHWDGRQLAAGRWSVHPYGSDPWFIVSSGHFGVSCIIVNDPKVPSRAYHNGVTCVNSTRHGVAQKAELRPAGEVKICRTHKPQGCGGGTPCGCAVDAVEVHPGEQVVEEGFTCLVARTSVACTVPTGQGFTITSSKMKRLSARAARSALQKPAHCVVPNIKGEVLNRAIKILTNHWCGLGTIKESAPKHHGTLRVIRQRPKPGTVLKLGGWVSMVLGPTA